MCREIYSVLVPKCSVATAVRAVWKSCSTVFGWDSNPRSKSLLITCVTLMSEFECSYFISQSISYDLSISIRTDYQAPSVYSVGIWKLLVIQASIPEGREI